MEKEKNVFFEEDGNLEIVQTKIVAVIGYGNQGRAQALNMRDSGLRVIIGNQEDRYREKARSDGFEVFPIEEAVKRAEVVFLLVPDENMQEIFSKKVSPSLKDEAAICFASGYSVAFGVVKPPPKVDVLLLAPRMIGVGVRETFLNGEGFFSFIGVHQDSTGEAWNTLLGLSRAAGTLRKGAVAVTFKQESVLDLYNEQAFGPAFGRVLLTAIDVLLKNGFPPEAALIEMYLSGEMSYTYQKMAQLGLINQTNLHSHTSQYGAISRGVRYMRLPLREKFQQTLDEISSGAFAQEWQRPFAKIKLKILKFFAMRQKLNAIENDVRRNLRMNNVNLYREPEDIEELLARPEVKNELEDDIEACEF
jgi:ketol-acid reductoisomerase